MSYGNSIRIAADPERKIATRVKNLMNAIEHIQVWRFGGTVDRLYLATGAGPGNWTPEQIDHAVRLVADAHRSWTVFKQSADAASRRAKTKPGYRRANLDEEFDAWRSQYFDEAKKREWHLLE